MTLSSHQRKFLEANANALEPSVRIGKKGLEAKIFLSVKDAFNTHELVKIKLLDTSPADAKEAAEAIVKNTHSELVCIIGRVIVLYKPFEDKPPKLILP